jgi:catechol 2,3-dioxygenase-like lactoylglutathione lyase family enzyme
MVKLDHLSLAVSDCGASRDWYVRHLDFSVEFEAPEGGPAGLGVVALQVDNVEALYDRLAAEGVAFLEPPSKLFWGYGAVLADPDGHRLHLYDEASMAAKG